MFEVRPFDYIRMFSTNSMDFCLSTLVHIKPSGTNYTREIHITSDSILTPGNN